MSANSVIKEPFAPTLRLRSGLKALSKGFMLRLRAQNALRSARTGFYSFRYPVNLVLAIALCCVATAALATPNIQHWQSASGAKVLFVENHDIPMLDVRSEERRVGKE